VGSRLGTPIGETSAWVEGEPVPPHWSCRCRVVGLASNLGLHPDPSQGNTLVGPWVTGELSDW
jgi:hypothetical protein